MNLSNLLSKEIILRLSDLITDNSIYKWLGFLEKSQFWSREQIDNYQNIRLRELIHHSYKNVPFYRELFMDLRIKPSDIQTKEDLIKLPIITKDDFRKSKGKHYATNIKKSSIIFASSSGSTGEPFQFYKTKHSESVLTAATIRGWNWMGYQLGDSYVKVSMNPRASLLKKIQDYLNNSLYLSSTQLTPVEFSKIAESILQYNPKYIRCYPIPLYFLSQQLEQNFGKYHGSSLLAINTTGSTLNEKVRNKIEEIFGVKVFDSYSCEGGGIFFECPCHDYYHPSEEYAIQEYLEDGFTFSDPEKPLRHITTDLHNFASPFIRYDTQDYIVMGDKELCTCGRHFQNIKKIRGRDSDILVTPSGKYLIVENFVAYFEWIPEVDQIQVIQYKTDEIVIKLIVNNSFTPDVKLKICNYWKNYIGSDINVIVEVVKEIKLTPTGKRRTVIRNPQISLNG
jgi:phenylacetate-CoA ligase